MCLKGKESEVEPKKSVRVRSACSVKKSSSIVKLDPELHDGLLCVTGRLRHPPIEQEQRHHEILPKKHHVVDLIVRHYHLLSGHSGQEYVLSLIRKSYWIIKGRVAVRRVVNWCFSCRRRRLCLELTRLPTFLLTESHLINHRSVLWALIVLARFGSSGPEVKLSIVESYSRVWQPEPYTWKPPRVWTLIHS